MKKEQNASDLMADAKFYESYARFDEETQQYETWEEAVKRVMDMHRTYYKDKMTPELEEMINFSKKAYSNKELLGAQRALQFGGEQLLKNNSKLYNCFSEDTKFVTSQGTRTFEDYNDGDVISVMTHKGKWKPAKVRNYGKDTLYEIELKKGPNLRTVKATKDHRWLLKDNKETTSLSVGDRIAREPSVFEHFKWETASVPEKKYWLYGLVFGDGTVTNTGHSCIRLCGNDSRFESRFHELGFKTSSPESIDGDVYAYVGKYQKTAPDPEVDSPEMIRAFVAGYLQADGEKNCGKDTKRQFSSIQATGKKHIDFIRECFPIAGVHIVSEKDYTGQITNYAPHGRKWTIRFTIRDHPGGRSAGYTKVNSITKVGKEDVWCLEVEDDKSFVLDGGVVTGNCTATYVDRVDFFKEALFLMLSGCFHPDTLVKTEKGDKKISELTVSDKVKSYNEESKIFEFIFPSQVIENNTEESPKIRLTFEDDSEIVLTENHEVLTQRGYVEAKDLTDSDDIVMDNI